MSTTLRAIQLIDPLIPRSNIDIFYPLNTPICRRHNHGTLFGYREKSVHWASRSSARQRREKCLATVTMKSDSLMSYDCCQLSRGQTTLALIWEIPANLEHEQQVLRIRLFNADNNTGIEIKQSLDVAGPDPFRWYCGTYTFVTANATDW